MGVHRDNGRVQRARFFPQPGGSPLHGLTINQQMRPLSAMKPVLTLPLGIHVTEADFAG